MALKVESLNVPDVVKVLENCDMKEYIDFVKEKDINGEKLLGVTEGIVKLWRPNINAKKFILFIQDLKINPEKYLYCLNNDDIITIKETNLCRENQYQTVSVRKISQQETNFSTVEEILKKITAPKSFLYRNHPKKLERSSYVPMDAGTVKKPKKFFRLSSYEYPIFDLKSRFSKTDNTDRGYYSVKTDNKLYIQKTCKKAESRPKYKSLTTPEEINDKLTEDHLYEDLCYNDIEDKNDSMKDLKQIQSAQVKPCIVKIQELFQSFRIPFFRKTEEVREKEEKVTNVNKNVVIERDGNIYENSSNDMYDSIHVLKESDTEKEKHGPELAVEDYLEPVKVSKDYCDVCLKQRDESLLGFIMNYFESRLGIKRETNDVTQSEESETEPSCEREWERNNMAARPLPVPVENEPYYMSIDRTEAENLLIGQPDGTFILRPSSQTNHAYTLSVSCANSVHNVGVRRRPDGRLGLGFARRGERGFTSVTSLLRHHKKKRLLLVAGGELIGATTLNETPQYYQTPSSLPIMRC